MRATSASRHGGLPIREEHKLFTSIPAAGIFEEEVRDFRDVGQSVDPKGCVDKSIAEGGIEYG